MTKSATADLRPLFEGTHVEAENAEDAETQGFSRRGAENAEGLLNPEEHRHMLHVEGNIQREVKAKLLHS